MLQHQFLWRQLKSLSSLGLLRVRQTHEAKHLTRGKGFVSDLEQAKSSHFSTRKTVNHIASSESIKAPRPEYYSLKSISHIASSISSKAEIPNVPSLKNIDNIPSPTIHPADNVNLSRKQGLLLHEVAQTQSIPCHFILYIRRS